MFVFWRWAKKKLGTWLETKQLVKHLGEQLYGDHPGKCTMRELSVYTTVGSRHETGAELRHRWQNYDFQQLLVTHDWSKKWQSTVKEQRVLANKMMSVLVADPKITNDELQRKMFPYRSSLRTTRERTRKLRIICNMWGRGEFESHYKCLLATWSVYHPKLNIDALLKDEKGYTLA